MPILVKNPGKKSNFWKCCRNLWQKVLPKFLATWWGPSDPKIFGDAILCNSMHYSQSYAFLKFAQKCEKCYIFRIWETPMNWYFNIRAQKAIVFAWEKEWGVLGIFCFNIQKEDIKPHLMSPISSSNDKNDRLSFYLKSSDFHFSRWYWKFLENKVRNKWNEFSIKTRGAHFGPMKAIYGLKNQVLFVLLGHKKEKFHKQLDFFLA